MTGIMIDEESVAVAVTKNSIAKRQLNKSFFAKLRFMQISAKDIKTAAAEPWAPPKNVFILGNGYPNMTLEINWLGSPVSKKYSYLRNGYRKGIDGFTVRSCETLSSATTLTIEYEIILLFKILVII